MCETCQCVSDPAYMPGTPYTSSTLGWINKQNNIFKIFSSSKKVASRLIKIISLWLRKSQLVWTPGLSSISLLLGDSNLFNLFCSGFKVTGLVFLFSLKKLLHQELGVSFNSFLGRKIMRQLQVQSCLEFDVRSKERRGLEDWNKVVIMKQIWNLFVLTGWILVAWVNENLLKDKSF